MAKTRRHYDASGWTGDSDPSEAMVLAIVLLIGVIGFVIIGAAVLG